LFELARVYRPSDGELPDERWHAAGIATGGIAVAKRAVEQLYGALRVELAVQRGQGELFHPGRAGSLQYGVFGELRPGLLEGKWGAFELDLDSLFDATPARLQFEELLSFPAVRPDLAFVVAEGVSSAELVAAMREAAGSELRDVRVFDEYKSDELGPGRKSLAFAVSFQSPERTLTDEDAAQLRRLVVDALAERFGAELRA
jgi:phenylalanyl-tRNA synthetase beta chain